jgi:small multidrug resistance family-3 protein
MEVIKSILYFILAGLCEIGGGYLIWLWLREGGSISLAFVGGIILVLYGVIATFQPANFGTSLRCLWWDFYSNGHNMGMASR